MTAASPSDGCCWVRPLGLEETLMEAYHSINNMTISHALWLSSTTPLTHSTFSNSLWDLYRSLPNLRHCVRTHPETSSPWYHKMDTITRDLLDLQEVRGQRFSQVYQRVMHTQYPLHHGPLWCVRYLDLQHNIDDSYMDPSDDTPLEYSSPHAVEDDGEGHSPKNKPSSDREDITTSVGDVDDSMIVGAKTSCVKELHRYIVIFGFCHLITDGVSNMRITHHFLHLLNQELMGVARKVVELGVFKSPVAEEQGLNRRKSDPTQALRNKCRTEGVSFHAAFTSAAVIAMVQLLHDAPCQDSRVKDLDRMSTLHDVNCRRYWPQPHQDVLGVHAAILQLSFPTPVGPMGDGGFWRYAKQLHTHLKEALTRQLVVQQLVCDPSLQAPEEIIREGQDRSLTSAYFGITNLCDLSSLISGTGDPVDLTSAPGEVTPALLTRIHHSTTCHFTGVVCQHLTHTFRGRLLYNLDFFTDKMRREEATKYAHLTLHFLLRSI
ncbi:hypothetical protein Hamer_G015139 [Homarus americanus]|uniref:Uncharacterized protein n=1 Tax=Homarus americanus TaxID=6706 RepID=A0A8J5N7Y6_HOMAM|nr:hypothetical protein Hamer_G015139 [Homarus americanus]